MSKNNEWYTPFQSLDLCGGILTPILNDDQDMLEIKWADGMWIDVGYIGELKTYYITTVADDTSESWNHPLSETAVKNRADLLTALPNEIYRCRGI